MGCVVLLTDRALADIDSTLAYYKDRSSPLGHRWIAAIELVVARLEDHPQRYPLAREARRLGSDLRQVNFGVGRRLSHRAVYLLRESRVVVYTVRHLAQQDLEFEDLL